MRREYLTKGWSLRNETVGLLPAAVPGCVHTDLEAGGVIRDLYWRDNNRNYQWIEEQDWTYHCRFDAVAGEPARLVFEGLDTYADIYLNRRRVGQADDMFISHSFDVTGTLQNGENTLEVRFRSPIREVAGMPERSAAFTGERLNTRRMQCTYGWDWVDRFVTCGIFRPVYLLYGQDMDVESLSIRTENIDSFSAQICVEYAFVNSEHGATVETLVLSPEGEAVARTKFYADQPFMVRRFDIAAPRLWYPNGYGEQPLYTLAVRVGENETRETFGIRTLKIMQLPDTPHSANWERAMAAQETEIGKIYSHNQSFSGFQVVVNGVRILCKGANWVPCEPFPSAETDEKLERLVELARRMNANILRVWGGGLPEKKAFYDACDRAGLLVAHDFMMACGEYPEKEEWFIEALRRESEYAVKLLRNHPCLAWWHGDNENATEGSDLQTDYRGRDTALRGIAPQIYRMDTARQFLPSSPYGGDTYGSITCGTTHNSNYCWNIFKYFHESDCTDYKRFLGQFTARFIAEEPTVGASAESSLRRFLTEEDIFEDETEEMIRFHTKNNPALDRHLFDDIRDFTEKVLGTFRDGHDRIFKYRYIQYEWVRVAFENCRRNLGYCNGLIFWMLNDCWPAALSWSLLDYYCLPKAGYYSFARCAKPLAASVEDSGDGYTLTVSNDADSPVSVGVTARLLDPGRGGAVEDVRELHCDVDAYGRRQTRLPWPRRTDRLIVCDTLSNGQRDRCFYKEGTLPLLPVEDGPRIIERGDDFLTLEADRYIHVVELKGDHLFEDNYFSLLPGERRRISWQPLSGQDREVSLAAYTLS